MQRRSTYMVHVCAETTVHNYVVTEQTKELAESRAEGKFCKQTGKLPTGLFSRILDTDNKED